MVSILLLSTFQIWMKVHHHIQDTSLPDLILSVHFTHPEGFKSHSFRILDQIPAFHRIGGFDQLHPGLGEALVSGICHLGTVHPRHNHR